VPETILQALKFCFLALLYLFLFRVVRVVLKEMRAPAEGAAVASGTVSKGRKQARLRILEPPGHKGEVYALTDEVTVGRGGGCGIVLTEDQFVSTVHARLFRRGEGLYVEDLGSRNGTFVNGEQVQAPHRLRRGDRVQFGETVGEVVR
jgi:pSer/pThr/pTyr-binding forkhead associated (FHA) protein